MRIEQSIVFVLAYFVVVCSQSQNVQLPVLSRQRRCEPFKAADPTATDLENCRREVAAAGQIRAPGVDKRTDEIVTDNGYHSEMHNITSEDGYIVTVYRIVGGEKSFQGKRRPAALVHHGLGTVSDSFLIQPFNRTIAYKLVEAGYEVWLANGRGSDFSLGHRTLNSETDIEYWDFSFHEMGVYDLPATIDRMLKVTGNEKIFFVGISQAGSSYFAALSEIPELNEKIHAGFLFAPAAYIGGASMQAFTMFLPLLYTPLEKLLINFLGGRITFRELRFLLPFWGLEPMDVCSKRALQCDLCDNTFYSLFNFSPNQVNFTNTPYLLRALNTAGGKQLLHLGQNILSCQFRKYDFGSAENLQRYGSTEPPSYQLGNVRTPTHIYYGPNDELVPYQDIQRLLEQLPQDVVREVYRVQDNLFNHMDFFTGKDADILIYEPLLRSMNQYL